MRAYIRSFLCNYFYSFGIASLGILLLFHWGILPMRVESLPAALLKVAILDLVFIAACYVILYRYNTTAELWIKRCIVVFIYAITLLVIFRTSKTESIITMVAISCPMAFAGFAIDDIITNNRINKINKKLEKENKE